MSGSADGQDDGATTGGTTGGNTSVIELSSEGEGEDVRPVPVDKGKKRAEVKAEVSKEAKKEKISIVKGHRVANPLEVKERPTRVRPATTNANDAITSMGNYFTTKPVRDEARGVQSYQMMQLQTLQAKLQQERRLLREQSTNFNEQLYQERRRADRAEDEVRRLGDRLETMRDELREARRRSSRYDSRSRSPPARRHRYRRDTPSRSPVPRREQHTRRSSSITKPASPSGDTTANMAAE